MNNNLNTINLLNEGLFLSIELSPSLNKNIEDYLQDTNLLNILPFVSDILITDSPLGKYTHNPILSSLFIKQHLSLNVISTFSMRDKNTPYALSEIRTAEELGLNSFMFVTGDKTISGKNVFEKNSTDFLKEVCIQKKKYKLNTLMFSTCSNVLNEHTKRKIKKKILNGADVFISQPVTSLEEAIELRNYINEVASSLNINRSIYFIAGLFPVLSLKTAIFLQNNVPGAEVSDILFSILKEDNSYENALNFNKSLFNSLIENNFNIHLMTSNNFELMFNLLKKEI